MFTFTFRLRRSAILTTLLVAAVAVLTVMLLPQTDNTVQAMKTGKPPRCESNEDRVAWLTSMGWEVEATPSSELSVVIPAKFDELYSQYAILQRQGGFRLEKHRGKTADKYCYTITNYGSGEQTAVASILQRGDRIIAADLSSARLGGFLKPMLPRSATKMK